MAILTVGPTSTFPTIAAAMAAAAASDTILLQPGYSNETATVTHPGMTVSGDATSTGIILQLGAGIATFFLAGTAPINVLDTTDGNGINGNDGDNIITVTGGADAVSGGLGTDRLVVDYRLTSGAVTGNSTTNVADAGGLGTVTINGGFEHFTILTGSGADTITTGAGDDIINTGEGASTVTAGAGANSITGGSGADTVTALDGGNFIDGGGGDNTLTSGGGNDVITGGLGVDIIVAGGGDDVVTVQGGADTSNSGTGNDRLIVDYSTSTTAVTGGVTGGDLLNGYSGHIADLAGNSIDFLTTENFTITTGSGSDVITTSDGDDVLDGGAGSDQLNGGGGSDTLLIGLGDDTLDGGANGDTVMFSGTRANYQVNDLGGGVIQTIDLRSGSPDGTDTLVNMEGFAFTDGTFDATTVLNVAPTLGGDLAIAVANGGTVVVTAADLTATDADSTNSELVYTVTGTLHGTVLLSGTAATSFTETDILANAVSFQHDGSASDGSFTVSLTDGTAVPQMTTVTAIAGNAAPSATNDALSAVAEDSGQRTILGSTLTGNDSAGPASENGQTLTVTAVSNVIGGSAIVSGGNVLFTPTANFNGAASFDYTVTDDGTTNGTADPLTATATASFTVTEANDAPSATNDALSAVNEDSGQRTIPGSSLTGNDSAGPSSESGQTLTVTAVSNVIGGSASVSGGNVLFTPTANFNGAASFDYTATDNGTTNGTSAPLTATATASFTVNAVDEPPAILTVGPTSTFPTIAAALAAAGTGDIISLEAGYGNENATVTVDGLSFDGGPSSTNINLQLASGISSLTLLGTAPINVLDGADANTIVGNDGDNVISVSSGVDQVSAGNGTDRLIIDYSAATASVTGTTVDVTDGGTHAVTFTGVENFTISTGSGNDTITVADGSNVVNTGGGDDTITAGNGPNVIDGGVNNDTITAGAGANTIDGGLGNDTIVAGDGGNTVNGGGGDDDISTGIGDDVVIAGLGNDTILTSAGADVTTVNGGIDTVDSGSESDRLIVNFSSSTTNVNGGVTGGTLAGGYDGAFADVAGTSSVVFQATENFTITTGSGNDVIATGDGDDVLDGGAGGDQLNGGGGADTLLIGLGSDALDGGAGTDTTIFSAARSNYQVNDLGGGVLQTIDLRAGSPDGTDTLVNMEGFVFTDGTFDAVTILNDSPVLSGDRAIAVANGGMVTVTAADLTATDSDSTNAQLVYTVTSALHGAVLLSGAAASSFTEADILANAVSFQHDGSATDGSFTVSLTDGTATPQVATVTAAITIGPQVANDFDGDGHSDILWQNSDGTPAVWLMDGTGVATYGPLLFNSGPSWHEKAAADFNADGKADILWQTDSGAAAVWLMDGTGVATAGPVLSNPGSTWQVKDAADFNADGKADILWQNDDGAAAVWLMDGTGVATVGPVLSNPGPTWHAKAAADFDADGKADILWQNDNGAAAVWLMDGTGVAASGPVLSNPGPAWHVKAAADFNADGKADILWQNDSGAAAVWLMDGTGVATAGPVLSNPGPAWHAKEAGDYNGDGKADILWQNDDGTPGVWLMDGVDVMTTGGALSNPGAAWHIV